MSKGEVRRYSKRRRGCPQTDWYLVSSHGAVLFYVAANPACSAGDLTQAMQLSRSIVWRLADDLRRANMLTVRKDGGKNRYIANLEAEALLPGLAKIRLRTILAKVRDNVAG